jgi:hypothetical protein
MNSVLANIAIIFALCFPTLAILAYVLCIPSLRHKAPVSMEVPKLGSVWRHKNGNVYRVILITNELSKKAEYPITVCYENFHALPDGTRGKWSRHLRRWHGSMTEIEVTQKGQKEVG